MSDNTSGPGVVIVGAGQGGGDLTGALRQQGYKGRITLIGEEPYAPYRRPPLSKQFLADVVSLEALYLKSPEYYVRQGIDCRYGIGVESIDRNGHLVRMFDDTSISYEHLVLATGGRARHLAVPGSARPNVHTVRTIDDILRLKAQFLPGRRLSIIGGGYIGLEAASVAVKVGLRVTLIEAMPRLLARVTAPELSAFYEQVHRAHGVEIRTAVGVHALEGGELVEQVVLSDGVRVPTDVVVVGIGLVPNTELAEAASLEVTNGIVVDACTRTADPSVYAIGDCSNHENLFLGRRLRLESVPNASEQARICAAAICGNPIPNHAAPWFWSDQYNLKLQMVGLSQGYDEIAIRGDMSRDSFCVIYLSKGIIISVDAVNRLQEFMVAKRLVAERAPATAAKLADERIPLKEFVKVKAA